VFPKIKSVQIPSPQSTSAILLTQRLAGRPFAACMTDLTYAGGACTAPISTDYPSTRAD
jgi:hypothetical protein